MHLPVMPKPSGLLTPILAKIWRPRSGREERSRLTRWPSLNWSFDRETDAYLSLPPFSISRSLSHRNSAALLVTVSDAIGTAFNAVVACRERPRGRVRISDHTPRFIASTGISCTTMNAVIWHGERERLSELHYKRYRR